MNEFITDSFLLLPRLGEECYKAGIPEEEAVCRTLRYYYEWEDKELVRATYRTLYMELKGFGSKPAVTREQETAIQFEDFLKRRYELRFNTVTDDLEYREQGSILHFFTHLTRHLAHIKCFVIR